MSYTSLYRKFRPQTFDDVKGQEHIVTSLQNQIKSGRLGHAYLFRGTRGTGKTTVAKILAKVVNCENPQGANPCLECESCKRIASGACVDVVEMDAASNNGVSDVRNIIEEVKTFPLETKYKVYIIDEAHMLTSSAFAALLKTLEEPPEYVIFILATTEIKSIPITILSRVQRYEFKRITAATIKDRLVELMLEEHIEAEEKALKYVAKKADGSMRDALSLLDECIAFSMNEPITYAKVIEVLGTVDDEIFGLLLESMMQFDSVQAIGIIEDALSSGKELDQFVNDFVWYLRNILLIKSGVNDESVIETSAERFDRMSSEASQISEEDLMRYIRIFSELSNQIRLSTQKRVLLEIAVIKTCNPESENSADAYLGRLEHIEKKLEDGAYVMAPQAAAVNTNITQSVNIPQEEIVNRQELPKAISDDIKEVVSRWGDIIKHVDPITTMGLKKALPTVTRDGQLALVFDKASGKDALIEDLISSGEDGLSDLKRVIESTIQKEVDIKVIINDKNVPSAKIYTNVIEALENSDDIDIDGIPIEEEDF